MLLTPLDNAFCSMAHARSRAGRCQHAGAVRDRGFGLRLHGRCAALRVLHLVVVRRKTGCRERLLQERFVVLHVALRRLRVGEEGNDLALALRCEALEALHRGEVAGERLDADLGCGGGLRRCRADRHGSRTPMATNPAVSAIPRLVYRALTSEASRQNGVDLPACREHPSVLVNDCLPARRTEQT